MLTLLTKIEEQKGNWFQEEYLMALSKWSLKARKIFMWNASYCIFSSAFPLSNDSNFLTSGISLPLPSFLTPSLSNFSNLKASLPCVCGRLLKVSLPPFSLLSSRLIVLPSSEYLHLDDQEQHVQNGIYLSIESYPFSQPTASLSVVPTLKS